MAAKAGRQEGRRQEGAARTCPHGRGPRPRHVQQHDRDDRRSRSATCWPGRRAGVQGSRARARERRSPRRSPAQARRQRGQASTACAASTCGSRARAPGASPRSARFRPRGSRSSRSRTSRPIPHNGCRPPKRASAFRRTGSAGGSYVARHTEIGLQALPARGDEALPQGRPLLQGQVRHRAPRLRARAARPAARPRSRATASSCARSRRSSASTASLERQFRSYFAEAERRKGITGANLLQMLERRLDNVVYRAGLRVLARAWRASSSPTATSGQRQASVDIPS